MTVYQKKKLIDLTLVITGIVLVGLFLRTQLSNPIILEIEETEALETQTGDYLIGKSFEDETDLLLPEYVDISASEVRIDNDYIDILITLRGIPELLPLGSNPLMYSVYFDVNQDGAKTDDVVVLHEYTSLMSTTNVVSAIDDEAWFTTKIIQMDEDVETILGAGEAVVDGRILYIRIPNSGKLEINDKTPFKILVSSIQKDQIYEDKMPSYSGE